MFEGPVSQWTDDQVEITAWCGFYHSIQSNVKPYSAELTDEIIADDKRLDAWWADYIDEQDRKRTGQQNLHDKVPKTAQRIDGSNVDKLGGGKRLMILAKG